MKKILFLGALICLMASCSKQVNLSTDVESVEFDETASTASIVINGGDNDCIIDYAPNWLNARMADSILVISTNANNSGRPREDVIILKNSKSSLALPVHQYPEATMLEFPHGKRILIPREGGTKDLAIDSDGKINVEEVEGLDLYISNGKLVAKAPANDGHRARHHVRVWTGDFSDEVEVIVDGEICKACGGEGKVTCKKCGGRGQYWDDNNMAFVGCRACGGSGNDINLSLRSGSGKVTCSVCNGNG